MTEHVQAFFISLEFAESREEKFKSSRGWESRDQRSWELLGTYMKEEMSLGTRKASVVCKIQNHSVRGKVKAAEAGIPEQEHGCQV